MAQRECGCHKTREDESIHEIYTESVAEWAVDQALVSRAAARVIASASFNTTYGPRTYCAYIHTEQTSVYGVMCN